MNATQHPGADPAYATVGRSADELYELAELRERRRHAQRERECAEWLHGLGVPVALQSLGCEVRPVEAGIRDMLLWSGLASGGVSVGVMLSDADPHYPWTVWITPFRGAIARCRYRGHGRTLPEAVDRAVQQHVTAEGLCRPLRTAGRDALARREGGAS